MTKKKLIGVAAGLVALVAATVGIIALAVYALNYNVPSDTDVWEDDGDGETGRSLYRDNPDPTPVTPRETQGRDYYEGGGYKGMDSYYIIQDLTVDEIIAEYEYYHDIAHTYDIPDLKDFDRELKHPAHTQADSGSLFMFYDLILPDEKIDHIASFYVEGTESTGNIEFTMKMRIHDPEKAMEIYNTLVDRYSEGSQGSEYYDMLNTFDKGVRITVDDSYDRIVCYKKVRDDSYNYYYLIHVSEDY